MAIKGRMIMEERIWEFLKTEYGITTKEELKQEMAKLDLDFGCFTQPLIKA